MSESAASLQPERDRWLVVKDVLASALETPRAERSALLDRLCGADADLRSEVEALLACSDDVDEFIERPAVADGVALIEHNNAAALLDQQIGPYLLTACWAKAAPELSTGQCAITATCVRRSRSRF